MGQFLKTELELKQQKLTELLKGHNNYMKTADQRRTLPEVTNATIGVKRNKGAIRSKELRPNPRFCASAIILRAVYRILIYISDQCLLSHNPHYFTIEHDSITNSSIRSFSSVASVEQS